MFSHGFLSVDFTVPHKLFGLTSSPLCSTLSMVSWAGLFMSFSDHRQHLYDHRVRVLFSPDPIICCQYGCAWYESYWGDLLSDNISMWRTWLDGRSQVRSCYSNSLWESAVILSYSKNISTLIPGHNWWPEVWAWLWMVVSIQYVALPSVALNHSLLGLAPPSLPPV